MSMLRKIRRNQVVPQRKVNRKQQYAAYAQAEREAGREPQSFRKWLVEQEKHTR